MQDSDTATRRVAGVGGVSAVSWGAIIAGTAVAAAVSLLLFALATGLDLASISAWPRRGVSAASVSTLAAVTLIVTQWISAALGGYITGRLRTSWVGTHTHEVFFRDTAHGFITWCVATVLLASGVIPAAAPSVNSALRPSASAGIVGSAPAPRANAVASSVASEPARIIVVAPGEMLAPRETLAEPQPAEGRLLLPVTPASVQQPRAVALPAQALPVQALPAETLPADVADARAAATGSVLTALAMLIGAFIACVSAALGGRLRDLHP
jgi:hypothetical protein